MNGWVSVTDGAYVALEDGEVRGVEANLCQKAWSQNKALANIMLRRTMVVNSLISASVKVPPTR